MVGGVKQGVNGHQHVVGERAHGLRAHDGRAEILVRALEPRGEVHGVARARSAETRFVGDDLEPVGEAGEPRGFFLGVRRAFGIARRASRFEAFGVAGLASLGETGRAHLFVHALDLVGGGQVKVGWQREFGGRCRIRRGG